MLSERVIAVIQEKLGDKINDYILPPPVFVTLQGEFVEFDQEHGILVTRFPVLEEYLNPYGAVQGGIVAAAVDNTLGPLSMLVAPANVTRRLEMKYSRPVLPDLGYMTVKGKYRGRQGQLLKFSAEVRDPQGTLLARAKAAHWIVGEDS